MCITYKHIFAMVPLQLIARIQRMNLSPFFSFVIPCVVSVVVVVVAVVSVASSSPPVDVGPGSSGGSEGTYEDRSCIAYLLSLAVAVAFLAVVLVRIWRAGVWTIRSDHRLHRWIDEGH